VVLLDLVLAGMQQQQWREAWLGASCKQEETLMIWRRWLWWVSDAVIGDAVMLLVVVHVTSL
jgi:hypothetical protein